jgi:hypothetical protein
MFKDLVVEEVGATRRKHAARFNFDLRKIAEDLRTKEQQSGRNVVTFPPQPANRKPWPDPPANKRDETDTEPRGEY